MRYTSAEAANIQMGQVGCSILTAASDTLEPPTGCVIVAIQIVEANTLIDALTAEDNTRWINTTSAAHESATHAVDSEHGDGGDTFPTNVYLFPGFTMYGRWLTVSVSAGTVIAYFGK